MKKLCVALALCLALVLACTCLAFADTEFEGESYEFPTRTHNGVLENPIEDRSTAPTCTENGVAVYQCALDPTLFHEVALYALGHTYDATKWDAAIKDGRAYVYKQGDCTHKTIYRWDCEREGCDSYIEKEGDFVHVWSSETEGENWGKITVEPTCTSEGEAIDYCVKCGVTRDKIRVIQPTDHLWTPVCDELPHCIPADDAFEMVPGKLHWECSICGEVDTWWRYIWLEEYKEIFDEDYDGHDWDGMIVEVAPTCQAAGQGVRFCKRCGEKQITVLPMIDHHYVETRRLIDCYTAEYTWACDNLVKDEDGNDVPCGALDPDHDPNPEYRDVVAHRVKKDKDHLVREVKPTCTEPGYKLYKCEFWDEVEHPADEDEALAEGALEKVITDPALGHDWGEWIVRYESGAGDNEFAYYLRTCKREGCGATEEKVSKYAPEACAEEDHNWVDYENGTFEATCTEDGQNAEQCTVCGIIRSMPVEALGHDWEITVLKEATCTEDGKQLKACKREGCGALVVEAIEKLGHKYEVQDNGDQICSVCGDKITVTNGLVLEDGEFKYYEKGEFNEEFTGIVEYDGASFWVVNGKVPMNANGLTICPDGKGYFLSQGQIQTITGMAEYDGEWFLIKNGELDVNGNGLYKYDGARFAFAAGQMRTDIDGLWQNPQDGNWYFLAGGQVQGKTGVAMYDGEAFLLKNGQLDTAYTGTYEYDGATFIVVNGQLYEMPAEEDVA